MFDVAMPDNALRSLTETSFQSMLALKIFDRLFVSVMEKGIGGKLKASGFM